MNNKFKIQYVNNRIETGWNVLRLKNIGWVCIGNDNGEPFKTEDEAKEFLKKYKEDLKKANSTTAR